MNIKKKILFTSLLLLQNNKNASLDKISLDRICADLTLVSPFTSAMRAIISAYIAYLINDVMNPEPAKKSSANDTANEQYSESKKLFNQSSKKILNKYGSIASGIIWSGLYTNFYLDKTTYSVIDNPYLMSKIKKYKTGNLAQVANELSMFGNFFELFAGYSKVRKSITRLTNRMVAISIQTVTGALALAGLYKVATDKTKETIESLVNKVTYLNDQVYTKDCINIIIPILCDILVLAPLFEHYLVPSVQGAINYYSPSIPTKVKLDNGLQLIKLASENFYNYQESEDIKDFKDMYTCLKYFNTIKKCIKNFKFLPFFK